MFRALAQLFHPPELENLSEREYRRLAFQAKYRRGDAIWILPALIGIAAGGAWLGLAWVLTFSFRVFAGGALISAGSESWWGINIFVGFLFFLSAFLLARWAMIVRSIRRILNPAECPFCDFSLVGLRISHGAVKCPECGQKVVLHEHRLKEADITIARPFAAAGERGAYQDFPEGAKRRGKSSKGDPSGPRQGAASGAKAARPGRAPRQ